MARQPINIHNEVITQPAVTAQQKEAAPTPVTEASVACDFSDFLRSTAPVFDALAWPAVVLLLAYCFRKPLVSFISGVPRWVRRIKTPGGFELELNREAAGEVRAYFENAFETLVASASQGYSLAIEVHQVSEKLQPVMTEALPRVLGRGVPADVRGTIYVPDILFKDYLYQLTDYYPPKAGGKAGRRFSQRYGIIGRGWRLKESIGRGSVVSKELSPTEVRRKLISDWGMLSDEAVPERGRPAYLCVLLKNRAGVHGILYIDSATQNAFGSDDVAEQFARRLETVAEVNVLTNAVSKALTSIRETGLFIEISE